ncbi:hypothetical protein RvY_01643 [Ramazzottius varieornatus]|uniref:hydroxymethylbilane synthase n=1 Tax=Ramazzottius varieornatus TaxID=947166 RepID=A0A1D1UP44_RAMVA|nr:hypothetical protein RvY_01643 [Ramazzottius varieornatus]
MGSEGRTIFRVGSRRSQLAMVQTKYVIGCLSAIYGPCYQFEIVEMETIGDKILGTELSKIGEKSLFTKELETALELRLVDFVVHSLKDLPTDLPAGMTIAAILSRENPQDAVVMRKDLTCGSLRDLPPGSVLGTSSLRRAAQLKRIYPHLVFKDVRGNLNTRLRKLDDPSQEYDALILAAAGLLRLGWLDRISVVLPAEQCLHAAGQGALAVECCTENKAVLDLLSPLVHPETTISCVAERAFLRYLNGGCSVPCAIASQLTGNQLMIRAGVYSLDGSQAVEDSLLIRLDEEDPTGDASQSSTDASLSSLISLNSSYVSIHPQSLDYKALRAATEGGMAMGRKLEAKGALPILQEARAQAKTANIPSIVPSRTEHSILRF